MLKVCDVGRKVRIRLDVYTSITSVSFLHININRTFSLDVVGLSDIYIF